MNLHEKAAWIIDKAIASWTQAVVNTDKRKTPQLFKAHQKVLAR
jgi:hypothetical protein